MTDQPELSTIEKINQYTEIDNQILNYQESSRRLADALQEEKQTAIKSIMPPELVARIEEIEAKFKPRLDEAFDETQLKELEDSKKKLADEIISEVCTIKESVSGDHHICVYTPAKTKVVTTVNVEQLKGLAKAIKKIQECYTETTETTPAKAFIRKR
ncbi:MAG: hypothetical protein M0R06_08315 [Sphaerochaeta sp.]|jgi:vacuolar-type H+-ATPase subunit I/STV1|nr:hypothetical protein [Sphaerochaeta sp.]